MRPSPSAPGDRLHADAVPFPFRHEVVRIERGEIGVVQRVRQHRRAERRRIAVDRLVGAALQPGEQLDIGRRKPGPEHLDLVGVLAAERGSRGLGEPRRDADAQAAGDQLEQRPAAGLVERIEPARELRRQLRLAERGERFDDVGQRRCQQSGRVDGIRAPATSAPPSPTGRRHSRSCSSNSTGSVRSAISARIMPAWRAGTTARRSTRPAHSRAPDRACVRR